MSLKLITVIAVVVGLIFTSFWIHFKGIYQQKIVYNYVTLGFFAITGMLCIVILCMLFIIIGKNFFEENLNREKRQLLICQSIFVFSFLLRVILILIVENKEWVDFTSDYPCAMNHTLFLPLQFFVYNFMPYITLMYLHWWNFRQQSSDRTQLDSDEDQQVNDQYENENYYSGAPLLQTNSTLCLTSNVKRSPSAIMDGKSHEFSPRHESHNSNFIENEERIGIFVRQCQEQ